MYSTLIKQFKHWSRICQESHCLTCSMLLWTALIVAISRHTHTHTRTHVAHNLTYYETERAFRVSRKRLFASFSRHPVKGLILIHFLCASKLVEHWTLKSKRKVFKYIYICTCIVYIVHNLHTELDKLPRKSHVRDIVKRRWRRRHFQTPPRSLDC